MSNDSTWSPGTFVWRELMTSDVRGATEHYARLFGWTYRPMDAGGLAYSAIHVGDRAVGGMVSMSEGALAPFWLSYVSVPDVDAAARAAQAGGGQLSVEPKDIPGVGRFAVVIDPDGAAFAVFRGEKGDPPAGASTPGFGEFCWETLTTTDLERAERFYADVVGWEIIPGPGDDPGVPVFAVDGRAVADLQLARDRPPSWVTYVVVDTLDNALARVDDVGGRVLAARIEIEHVGAVGFFADAAGAPLGLFEAPGSARPEP